MNYNITYEGEICDGCNKPGAMCEYDGFVFHNDTCWALAEQRWYATPAGRMQAMAECIAINVDNLVNAIERSMR